MGKKSKNKSKHPEGRRERCNNQTLTTTASTASNYLAPSTHSIDHEEHRERSAYSQYLIQGISLLESLILKARPVAEDDTDLLSGIEVLGTFYEAIAKANNRHATPLRQVITAVIDRLIMNLAALLGLLFNCVDVSGIQQCIRPTSCQFAI